MYRDLKVKALGFFKTQYKLLALELQAANSVEFSLREELGRGEGRVSVSCTGVLLVFTALRRWCFVYLLPTFPDTKGVTCKPPLPLPPTFPSVSASKKNSLFQSCTMVESLENLTMECRSSVVGDVAIKSLIETSIVA